MTRATYFCPNCWEEIPEGALTCPYCHKMIDELARQSFPEKLIASLAHPVPSRAALAARILGQLHDPRAVEPLEAIFVKSQDPELHEAAVRALGELRDPRALDTLVRILNDPTAFLSLRLAAVEALGRIGGEQAVAALRQAAHGDRLLARAAREQLLDLGINPRRWPGDPFSG